MRKRELIGDYDDDDGSQKGADWDMPYTDKGY